MNGKEDWEVMTLRSGKKIKYKVRRSEGETFVSIIGVGWTPTGDELYEARHEIDSRLRIMAKEDV